VQVRVTRNLASSLKP